MKIALLCDTHWGARGDHLGFLDYFEKFHNETFFPVLEKQGIRHILHLGDLVDRRKFINYYTASRLRHSFLDRLNNYKCTILAGNHDVYHKNTNEVNALTELVDGYKTVRVVTEPTEVDLPGTSALYLPWINSENRQRSIELIQKSDAPYCFGHLQLSGFEMHVGSFAEDGLDPKLFSNFEAVYTGHFHHKSSKGNIHYLGAPYEITWSDYSDLRGFHILDLATGELEFIQNPNSMFYKLIYDDRNSSLEKLLSVDFSKYRKRYVKIILLKKENPYWFETFFDAIEKAEPYDLQVVEDHLNLGIEEDPELIEKAQDTFTILNGYVDKMEGEIDKVRLKAFLRTLYDEASMIQV